VKATHEAGASSSEEATMSDPQRNTVIPYLTYENAAAAIAWLCDVFGFEEVLRHEDDAGLVNHAELRMGTGVCYLGAPGGDYRSPRSGRYPGSLVCVEVDDVDAHYAHARAAGAEISEEPQDQDYGDRRYAVIDPEGHRWFFRQHLSDVAPREWGAQPAG
jgi:uncharacterized glyoxalase superfamily protein PhnB